MAGTVQHRAMARIPPGAASRSGLFSSGVIESWWVKVPGRLRTYSQTLWAAWSDGIYLTAWPRAALLLPWAALLLGFVEGSTHWSLLTLGNDKVVFLDPAVIFAQYVPLLFIAVLLGSLSAHVGLMLVIGFALGDYLIAGPVLTILDRNPIYGFLYLRVPQLFCYALFFAVAVAPSIAGSRLVRPLTRKLAPGGLLSAAIRAAGLAAVTMMLVYGWTLVAPMVFRIVWFWVGQGPPISVKYFREVMNPWLPITAGLGIVARNILVWRTRDDQQLRERIKRLHNAAQLADQQVAWPRRLPIWFRATLAAAWSAFLLAGMMTTWLLAASVCAALVTLFLLRNCILPKLTLWASWTRKVTGVPLVFRIALVVSATYFATRGLLQIPGWAISQNAVPGQFGVLLACAAASLLINLVVIPFAPADSLAAAEGVPVVEITPAVRVAVQVLLLVLFLFLPLHAFASCMDPSCCMGDNGGAGGPMGAIGGGMGMGAAGGLAGSGGSGGEGGGSSGGADGGGDEPPPSSDGGPGDGGGGGSGSSSASGSSPNQGGDNSSSFGSASGPSGSGSSAPSSSSDQGTGDAGPGSASSPGDSGSSAPGSSSDQATSNTGPGSASSPGDSGSSAPGSGPDTGQTDSGSLSSPGSEATGDPGSSSPGSSPDSSGSTDGQQQYSPDQLQHAADDFQQEASQDQTAASDFQQQASQDQADANALQQEAKGDETKASALQQLASDDQQTADNFNEAANDAQDPSDAAALRQAANEAAEKGAFEQQQANQWEQVASGLQDAANQAAQSAADLQDAANQATQEAARDRQLANDMSSEAQAQRNASAPMTSEQPTANGEQGSPTSQPPPYDYGGPKKP